MEAINLTSKIEAFKIFGLYGKRNVNLDFSSGVKIYVGENGIGKTTILNIVYFTLSQRFEKLKEVDFDSVEIIFSDNEKITIKKEWLLFDDYDDLAPFFRRLKNILTPVELNVLVNDVVRNQTISFQQFIDNFGPIFRERGIPIKGIMRDIDFIIKNTDIGILDIILNNPIENIKRELSNRLKGKILYLPTYRRIEEDLGKLGLILTPNKNERSYLGNKLYSRKQSEENDRKEIDTELIQFGMDDVQHLIKTFTEEMKDSAFKGYSEVTGKMISQLVQDNTITQEMRDSIKNIELLNIVLDRVGSNLSESDKKRIRQLITNNDIFEDKKGNYNLLIYFLYSLINIYNQQKDKDNAIKKFAKVCSSYLQPNKFVDYDESSVKITIIDKRDGQNVELSQLSSGEKQIVSLFSKLYLTNSEEFYLLIDEPELSLSIEWQQKLLPDIIDSGKCSLLVAVTHSPFIYTNNELEEYADSMELYIEEIKNNE
jgi:predicted ATPase